MAGRLESAEVAGETRTPELVVESGGAERRLQHDLAGAGDVFRLFGGLFPRFGPRAKVEVAGGEAHQAGLGLGTPPHRAFVADLPAGTRGGAGEGGNGRGVVVRLHLHQAVGGGGSAAVDAVRAGEEAGVRIALGDGGVVQVRRHDAGAVDAAVGGAHRVEQGTPRRRRAVDAPLGVEDLVAAMFGVRLREHHQFHIRRVAGKGGECRGQVADLLRRERQAQALVGGYEGGARVRPQRHARQALGCALGCEQAGEVVAEHHRLGHAVVQRVELPRGLALEVPAHTALHPRHRRRAAAVEDLGGFARPRRDGARARRHHAERRADQPWLIGARAVVQKRSNNVPLAAVRFLAEQHEVNELGEGAPNPWRLLLDFAQPAGKPRPRKRRRAVEDC